MLPSNTVEILKSLNKSDFKKLGDFLKSPYFNSKETIYLLYKEIEKQSPEFKKEKFEYQRIYKKIYGGEYKEQTIKNLYSEFGSLLKKFIAHERLEQNENDYSFALINGLSDKKCYEQSIKFIEQKKNKDEKAMIPHGYYFLNNFAADSKWIKNILAIDKISIDDYHQRVNSMLDNLISLFTVTLFFYAREDFLVLKAHNVKKNFDVYKTSFLESFNADKFFNEHENTYGISILKIRYLAYKYAVSEISEKEYREFEKLITDNIDNFPSEFKIECWGNLVVTLILKLIPKDKKFYNDAFKISKYFDKLNLFNESSERIAISLYRDVFGVALMVKEFDWAQKFIEHYSDFLEEGSMENERNYSLGRLLFQQKKYEESIEYLSKVKFHQVYEKINVRFYYLMNYIELKSYQSAISMLNSIRQFYLESKEIPEMFAVLIENSLKFFREIIRVEENNKKLDYSVLKEAQNAGRYFQKPYILEKMEKLV